MSVGELSPNHVLETLSKTQGPVFTDQAFPNVEFAKVKSAVDTLKSREMIYYTQVDREEALLTPEAENIATNGSHEAKVWKAVHDALQGLKISDLPQAVGQESAKVGQGKAMKAGWIKKDNQLFRANVDSIKDESREHLQIIKASRTHPDSKILSDLKKRKLILIKKVVSFKVEKAANFALEYAKEETDLTADMLATGAWKTVHLKKYNFASLGGNPASGAVCGVFHPLNKVRAEFRTIFFEMGFEEMPTNKFVETGFWNFDALYVPQQHPARDLQDTFYISDPRVADRPREEPQDTYHLPNTSGDNVNVSPKLNYGEYWNNVREVHENGKYGSIGYRYQFDDQESLRLVLRTHTTAISTSMLYKLSAHPRPARYFSIDRVFRNETVDATHLAEFHQVEGVIADYNLTLGGLIGFMEKFFAKMGIKNLKFKPAYNPYTEPSMEIFAYHEGLGKLVEIGNSGMFRPEMLEPMGLPKDLRVYGWGLSLERPTMIKYGVSNIRDLLGHKVDLNFIERNAAVRLDKD